MNLLELFFLLIMGHCIADFSLQNSEMSKGKNRNRPIENVPLGQTPTTVWPYWLTAHAGVHAAAVYLFTHLIWAAAMEMVLHWLIDFMKCDNKLTVHQDQVLHLSASCGTFGSLPF